MDTAILTLSIMTLVSMIFSAFFSGMEIAFISSNSVRIKIDVEKKGLINSLISLFYRHKEMFITTMLVGNNIMLVIYGMGMAGLLDPYLKEIFNGNEAIVLITQTIISTIIILITGEFFPKTIFRINPNSSLRTFSLPLYIIYVILYPITWFSTKLSSALMRLFKIKINEQTFGAITVGELDAYLQENIETHEEENNEVEREVKIFQNALDFSDTHLRDCMIPRNEIVAVNIDTIERDALSDLFTQSGFSKIIVYHDDIDNVLGYIHVSELFTPENNWKKCIKPVLFAPETMLANKMMQNLLKQKRSMAIVVDEFGGTAGMVTLEDLVEEIFGEIEDEHDHSRLIAQEVEEGIYEFSGRIEIEEINERFPLEIEENDEYQTLAGYILYNLEAIPQVGETFMINDYTFSVIKLDGARIDLIRLITQKKEEK
ncbi:MAG: HlyC/CorC family transporter [Muribaculaceae bacterium]|nr:HlyC/CorC family transporter [Muribaculaceae bacterium]